MIKKYFTRFKIWCNSNQGLLAIYIALVGIVPFNKIKLGLASTFWDKFKSFLTYDIKIPIYLFFIIIIVGLIYKNIIKRKYKTQKITLDFLEGNWRNEWTLNNQVGSEMCMIKKDGKYYVNGEHWFTLENFKYDYKTNKITFIKSSVRSGDTRRMTNILTVDNNDLVSSTENNYGIRYTRL